jgi:hypothetical protein
MGIMLTYSCMCTFSHMLMWSIHCKSVASVWTNWNSTLTVPDYFNTKTLEHFWARELQQIGNPIYHDTQWSHSTLYHYSHQLPQHMLQQHNHIETYFIRCFIYRLLSLRYNVLRYKGLQMTNGQIRHLIPKLCRRFKRSFDKMHQNDYPRNGSFRVITTNGCHVINHFRTMNDTCSWST